MTAHSIAAPQSGYFDGVPGLFHVTSVLTIAIGIGLHVSRLPLGPEAFQQSVLTPLNDTLFAIPMSIAGLSMAWLWRRALLPTLWEKITYGFVTLFLLASIVLHARTALTWDTSYINAFPAWYPYIAVVYLALIGLFCATRRFAARTT